jgi:hypothetical protein
MNKILTIELNRYENDSYSGKKFEDWITHPERAVEGYKEKTEYGGEHCYSDGAGSYVKYTIDALREDRREGTFEYSVYYELEFSLSIDNEIMTSKTEKYDSAADALKELSSYLECHYVRSLDKGYSKQIFPGSESDIAVGEVAAAIAKKDEAINLEGAKKAFERIPLNIRRECKKYCEKYREEHGGKCSYGCAVGSYWNDGSFVGCSCGWEGYHGKPYTWEI